MNPPHAVLESLSREECTTLLAQHRFGRVSVVVDGQPLVFPVNYAYTGSQIVFRTDRGTKLHGAVGNKVAFEIDGVDATYHDGWSVLVIGTAFEETDPHRLTTLKALPLAPWTAGAKDHWVCIRASAISGRRITHEGVMR